MAVRGPVSGSDRARGRVRDPARERGRAAVRGLKNRITGLVRRGRPPGLRTAKTVLAAVVAFAVAEALHTSSAPVLAPLTALLVVQLTMYETVTHGRERIVSVVAGVLVAVLFASVTGLTWWSLGLVVLASLVAGKALRLGPNLMEVPISAMLVLAVGGAEQAALGRVVETLIGAAVGVLVNLLIAPPLYVQPASEAIADLAESMARFSEGLAEAVRGDWSRAQADAQLSGARMLGVGVARADRRMARAEESGRLNPRGGLAREAEPRLRSTLTALEHAQVGLRNLARALLDRTYFVPEDEAAAAYSTGARTALAGVLTTVGAALRAVSGVPAGPATGPSSADVDDHLATLKDRRDRLAAELFIDPRADPAAWAQHGALLDAVDRLGVEIATALRPPAPAAPSPLAARQRQAVRRAFGAATIRRPPRNTQRRRRGR